MPNPVNTRDIPHLLDKKIKRIYVKGSGKMSTDSGYMKKKQKPKSNMV